MNTYIITCDVRTGAKKEKGCDTMNTYNITCDVRTAAKKRKEVMPMQNQGEFAYCVRCTHVPWSTLYA